MPESSVERRQRCSSNWARNWVLTPATRACGVSGERQELVEQTPDAFMPQQFD